MNKAQKLEAAYSEASRNYLQHLVADAKKDKRAAKCIADMARGPLVELHKLIHAGNPGAAEALADFVSGAVESLTYSHPSEAIAEVAKNRNHWPVLLSAREKDGEAFVRAFALKIKLGRETGLKLGGKKAQLSTPETAIAFSIWQQIEQERRAGSKLPAISRNREALKKWRARAEEIFLRTFGENFEEHPDFRHWRKKLEGATVDKKTNDSKKVHFPRWKLRNEIKKKVLQSLERLAS